MTVINLGNLKFTWKGDWAPTTAYNKDDIVKYGPSVYVCVDAHTSASVFADNVAKFEVMSEGLESSGVWGTSTLYKKGQTVTYGGAVYIALQESTNQNPYDQPGYWSKFVDGQQFEGNYSISVNYQKGDIVYYGGFLYVCKQNSLNNDPTNTVYWDIYSKGYENVGAWGDATQYRPGDVVNYGGNQYVVQSTKRPLGQTENPSNTSFWDILSTGLKWLQDWNNISDYAPNHVVKYGGKIYVCKSAIFYDNVNPQTPPTIDTSGWDLLVDGFNWKGGYDGSTSYKPGDVVRLNGRSYICTEGYENDGSTSPEPPNADYWELFSDGFYWRGAWDIGTEYEIGDVVEYATSSYVSLTADNTGTTPGTDNAIWQMMAQGDSNAVVTTKGDIIFRDATQVTRLPVGPSGSFLTVKDGQPSWGHLTPQNDYYVSPQGDDTNDGRTPTTSWKTLRHATNQTFSLGQCRINVQAGQYTEQCPIRVGRSVVLEGNGLGAVTLSPDTTNDNGFGVGISDDGSTPNANSAVFHMNNGCRLRNFVFRNFSTGSVIVGLDPGTGPDDTSVWITSQSPYVQNCTSFTPGGTGFKIDGGLHNGGYKSMVANDWTQINSDGVGVHALNDGRTEIVSCFTYYCNNGYLAESGGKIRAIVGNNSYGEYGAVARGYSQLETPLTGTLQLTDQTINSVTQLGSNVHVFTSYRDSVGNRIFVGHTNPTGTNVTSSWSNTASYPFICKFNSAGSLDWVYTYESSYGAVHSVVEVSDRYYAGGVIYDSGTNKGFILAISKAGEIQWQKTIGDTSEIADVTTDGNNLYAIGTHTTTGSSVTKLNPAGVEQWSRTLEYNDSAAANTLVASSACVAATPTTSTDTYALAGDATASGNIYIASYDSTANQSVITRLESNGAYVASYIYGDVRINKLRLDTGNGDGIYLVAAGYYDAGAVNKNPLAFRINVKGDIAWQKQIALSTEEGEWKDVLPFGNDIYLVGYMNESTNNNNTGLVARYTSAGAETWTQLFDNGTNNVALNGVMLDGVNVIAAGLEQGNSVILNVQRNIASGIGTVTSGSYVFAAIVGETQTTNTVVTKSIEEITAASLTLGSTDSTLTLNQSPSQTRTLVANRQGFAGIGTGVIFTIDNLSRSPKEGSVLQITGDTETYFVIGVSNFDPNTGIGTIQIDPAIPSNKTPDDSTSVVFREAFSQVRMSGHDFLDIGTGGFADTNYPVIIQADYPQQPDQNKETLAEDGGRVFYVTTDQDGNFRVGDYFKVEQATGRATLSSEEFDLSGLNELQLGSITAGRQGATVNEFSTDGTFADNSDESVPTEKAVKTYVDQEITSLSASQGTIVAGNSPSQSKVEVNGTGAATDTIDFDIAGVEVAEIASSHFKLPTGTTANRPGTPASGMFRYNTTTNSLEVYGATSWEPAGSIKWSEVSTASAITKGEGYMCDTTGGGFIITLPASPAMGDAVRILDLAGTFDSNNLVLGRNGNNIMGLAEDLTLSTENSAVGLVYTNATQGWKLIEVL